MPPYNKKVPNKTIMDDLQLCVAQMWADHYNFLLSLTSLYEEWEQKWFEEQYNFNKIYDC